MQFQQKFDRISTNILSNFNKYLMQLQKIFYQIPTNI